MLIGLIGVSSLGLVFRGDRPEGPTAPEKTEDSIRVNRDSRSQSSKRKTNVTVATDRVGSVSASNLYHRVMNLVLFLRQLP